jgi:hypothetical protein
MTWSFVKSSQSQLAAQILLGRRCGIDNHLD